MIPAKILDPAEWASPSGQYRLFVDPTERHGAGPAHYRLTCDGHEVWSGERPFTFWEAAVADDGTCGGFAYPAGWGETDGSFVVALLGPDGTIRLREDTPLERSGFFHTPPNPLGLGTRIDLENNRLIIRVSDSDLNRHLESWWIYRVSTAAPERRLEPDLLHRETGAVYHVITASPVPRTPLMLVHWWRYDRKLGRGATFTLSDLDGKAVWQLDLPGDYEDTRDEEAGNQFRREIEKQSALLGFGRPGQFTLRFARAGQAVTFAANATDTGEWNVREVDATPYGSVVPELPRLELLPRVLLEPRGQVTLRNPPGLPDPEIRDIGPFACAENGMLGFLRLPREGARDFVLVEESGRTRSFPLPGIRGDSQAKWVGCVWLGNDRFLVVRSSHRKGSKAHGWWVHAEEGTITPLPTELPASMRVAPLPDGGFVVMTWRRYDSSLPLLCAYDHAGQPLPTIQDLHQCKVSEWSHDLCLTTSGKIGILTSKDTVVVLEPTGQFLTKVTLALGDRYGYFRQLRAWAGGFILFGLNAVLVFDAEGALLRAIEPSPNDTDRPLFIELETTPDGHLWTTDGQELRRLDLAGNPDRSLGRAPDPDRLDVPWTAILGADDQFYVLGSRTHALHVFDRDGSPFRVLKPLPTDRLGYLHTLYFSPITLDVQGKVYVGPLEEMRRGIGFPTSHYLAFSPEGQRLGSVDLVGSAGRNCQFQPGTQRRWVWGRGKGALLDEDCRIVRTLERRADGTWIGHHPRFAVGRDGSLAIFERARDLYPETTPPDRLTLVNPDGEVVRTFDIPHYAGYVGDLALGPQHAVLIGERAGLFVDLKDGRLQRFELSEHSGPKQPTGQPFFNAAGTELLLYDSHRTFRRFQLPNSKREPS